VSSDNTQIADEKRHSCTPEHVPGVSFSECVQSLAARVDLSRRGIPTAILALPGSPDFLSCPLNRLMSVNDIPEVPLCSAQSGELHTTLLLRITGCSSLH
jgi:hypothetical protein